MGAGASRKATYNYNIVRIRERTLTLGGAELINLMKII